MQRGELLVQKLETRLEHGPVPRVRGGLKIVKHSDPGMLKTLPFALKMDLVKVCAGRCRGGTPVRR